MTFLIIVRERSFGGHILFIEDKDGLVAQMIPPDNDEAASVIVEAANRGAVLKAELCHNWLCNLVSMIPVNSMGDKETPEFTFSYQPSKLSYWVDRIEGGERLGYTDDIAREQDLFVEVFESVMNFICRQ